MVLLKSKNVRAIIGVSSPFGISVSEGFLFLYIKGGAQYAINQFNALKMLPSILNRR
jgi:hypothetical protein